MRFHWHLAVSFLLGGVLFSLDGPNWPGLAALLCANLIDLDHLAVAKFDLRKLIENYYIVQSYPLHKVQFIIPAIFCSMFFAGWFGAGLMLHFLMDYFENESLFKGKFRWT